MIKAGYSSTRVLALATCGWRNAKKNHSNHRDIAKNTPLISSKLRNIK